MFSGGPGAGHAGFPAVVWLDGYLAFLGLLLHQVKCFSKKCQVVRIKLITSSVHQRGAHL